LAVAAQLRLAGAKSAASVVRASLAKTCTGTLAWVAHLDAESNVDQ
jgi:hypothetical protein